MDASKGQHFMVNENLLKRIVNASNLTAKDKVLEIGSGAGALTNHLKNTPADIITVELDKKYPADVQGNILEVIEKLHFNSVVSNLPYQISEPLFVKLTKSKPAKIVVVVGEKFAKQLNTQSIIGLVIRELYSIEVLESIPPSAFSPRPRVQSSLVRLMRKSSEGIMATFYEYPKSKVKNYIKTLMQKKEAQEFINKLTIQIQEKRLYELNTKEFVLLYEALH